MYDVFSLDTFEEYEYYLNNIVLEENIKINELNQKLDRKKITIDEVINDTNLTEREYIELIASRRKIGYDPSVGGGNKAAEDETDRLYAKNPWKFVEEFLQNADDCNYIDTPEIDITIDETKSSIEFTYNEVGFRRSDIWAIAAFSESTKKNDIVDSQVHDGIFYTEKTGRKGKGFKSVFSLHADNIIVHIRSNGFSFRLDNIIGRVMPIWENELTNRDYELLNTAISEDFTTRQQKALS